uniref:Uncharacterized protein n=1 Tax=Piliocolobus tephrosceles TaxID=591936 RepID=A0A8C9LZT8_9PRIM
MSSMDWPFSSFFSISTMSFTPSTTSCTCSTSDEPSRSALDTSNTEPTAAVSTPPVGARHREVKRQRRCRGAWTWSPSQMQQRHVVSAYCVTGYLHTDNACLFMDSRVSGFRWGTTPLNYQT